MGRNGIDVKLLDGKTANDLKPCPFCGSKVTIHSNARAHTNKLIGEPIPQRWVRCLNQGQNSKIESCGVTVSIPNWRGYSVDVFVDAWNRREATL